MRRAAPPRGRQLNNSLDAEGLRLHVAEVVRLSRLHPQFAVAVAGVAAFPLPEEADAERHPWEESLDAKAALAVSLGPLPVGLEQPADHVVLVADVELRVGEGIALLVQRPAGDGAP